MHAGGRAVHKKCSREDGMREVLVSKQAAGEEKVLREKAAANGCVEGEQVLWGGMAVWQVVLNGSEPSS